MSRKTTKESDWLVPIYWALATAGATFVFVGTYHYPFSRDTEWLVLPLRCAAGLGAIMGIIAFYWRVNLSYLEKKSTIGIIEKILATLWKAWQWLAKR